MSCLTKAQLIAACKKHRFLLVRTNRLHIMYGIRTEIVLWYLDKYMSHVPDSAESKYVSYRSISFSEYIRVKSPYMSKSFSQYLSNRFKTI